MKKINLCLLPILLLSSCGNKYPDISKHPDDFTSKYWLFDVIDITEDNGLTQLMYEGYSTYKYGWVFLIENQYYDSEKSTISYSLIESHNDRLIPDECVVYAAKSFCNSKTQYIIVELLLQNIPCSFYGMNLDNSSEDLLKHAYSVGFEEAVIGAGSIKITGYDHPDITDKGAGLYIGRSFIDLQTGYRYQCDN